MIVWCWPVSEDPGDMTYSMRYEMDQCHVGRRDPHA